MTENSRPLWEFVPIDHYSRPAEPAAERVRKGVFGVWDRLRRRSSPEKSLFTEEDLRQVPEDLLQQAVPPPAWDNAVSALNIALERWLEAPEQAAPVQVVVGSPFAGMAEIATHWAHAHQWRLVSPPWPAHVLDNVDDWFNEFANDTTAPLVIPSLEGCYLRHHDGLALMRRLIDWLCAERPRCLLGCTSWAWSYFRKVLEVDVVFAPPLTLQAFDDERLRQWFRLLASGKEGAGFKFLQANSGKSVLTLEAHGAEAEANEQGRYQINNTNRAGDVTHFLQYVAGRARGNPGVAWSIWRHSLQRAVDDTAQEAETQNDAQVLWVKPWSEIDLPFFSSQRSQNDLLVLHALLLHDGLPAEILLQIIPCTPTAIMHSVHALHACGMLEQINKQWQVTALGYPAAREILEVEGYLNDQF